MPSRFVHDCRRPPPARVRRCAAGVRRAAPAGRRATCAASARARRCRRRRSCTRRICGWPAPARRGRQAPLRRHRRAVDAADPRRAGARARRAEALGRPRSRVAVGFAGGRRRRRRRMLPALDEALTRLEQIDPEQARIVELRFFAGLSIEEAAEALGMSPATLKRRWALARAWLLPRAERADAADARTAAARPRSLRGRARPRAGPDVRAWLDQRSGRRSGGARRGAVAARSPLACGRVSRREPIGENAARPARGRRGARAGRRRSAAYTIVREIGRGGMGRVYLATTRGWAVASRSRRWRRTW